jgi:hypothetical protein
LTGIISLSAAILTFSLGEAVFTDVVDAPLQGLRLAEFDGQDIL